MRAPPARRIRVAYVSRSLANGPAMRRGLDLRPYDALRDRDEPAMFVGQYAPEDLAAVRGHRGPALVLLRGSDRRNAAALADPLNRLPRPRVRVLSPVSMAADLRRAGLTVDAVRNVFGGDPAPFALSPAGPGVYAYLPYQRREEYGLDVVRALAREFADVPFYLGRWGAHAVPFANGIALPDWQPRENMVAVYRQCFCAVRPIAADGFPASAVEMALMGRPSGHRVDHGMDWLARAATAEEFGAFVESARRGEAGRAVAQGARRHVEDRSFLELPADLDLERAPPPIGVPAAAPWIAAAMIVRDEQEGIGSALDSLRGVVDEVVVVDTGSTDRTREVVAARAEAWAREGGPAVRLSCEPWREDFALARNVAQARTSDRAEWIVVLDGDEVLDAQDLREAIAGAAADVDAVAVRVVAEVDGGVEEAWVPRAYRKARGRWRYPVHNVLDGCARIVACGAEVRTSYRGEMEDRARRSLPLLQRLHRAEPHDPHAPFYLAKTFHAARRWEEVARWCEVCRELCPDTPEYAQFWAWWARALLATRGRPAAQAVLDEGLSHHPDLADLWHQRMFLDAVEWVRTAGDPGDYLLAGQQSPAALRDVDALAAALAALKLPIRFVTETDAEDRAHGASGAAS